MTKHLSATVRIQRARTASFSIILSSVHSSFAWADGPQSRFRPWPRMASPCSTTRHLLRC